MTGNWIQTAGVVDPGTSTIHFVSGNDKLLTNANLHNVVVDLSLASYQIHATGTNSLSGDLTLTSGRLHLNDSALYVSGDLQRDNTYTQFNAETSSVFLDGDVQSSSTPKLTERLWFRMRKCPARRSA